MKFRRGWLNELPLPRGERVGVRGFGRFRIKLHRPNPLILSFSPLGRRDAARPLRTALPCLLWTTAAIFMFLVRALAQPVGRLARTQHGLWLSRYRGDREREGSAAGKRQRRLLGRLPRRARLRSLH